MRSLRTLFNSKRTDPREGQLYSASRRPGPFVASAYVIYSDGRSSDCFMEASGQTASGALMNLSIKSLKAAWREVEESRERLRIDIEITKQAD